MLSARTQKIQSKTIKVLASVQVLAGIGSAGTVAAGSLLVASITNSETLAGLAQTSSVLGAAAMALPLSRLTQKGGRRLGLSVGYCVGALGALSAIIGGTKEILIFMLLGAFLIGAASASGGGAGSAGTGTIATSATAFSINSVVLPSGTIAGAFLTSNSTKGGSTGTLYSAGSFTTGNRTVLSGDTLNVTYTANC